MDNNIKKSDEELSYELTCLQQQAAPYTNTFSSLFKGLLGCGAVFFANFVFFNSTTILYMSLAAIVILVIILIPVGAKANFYTTKMHNIFMDNNIVKDVLCEFFKVLEYDKYKHINSRVFKDTNLMPTFDKISGGDYVKGIYRGSNIEFSDITLTGVSKGKSNSSIVFKGMWIVYDLDKEVPAKLLVRENIFDSKSGKYRQVKNDIATDNTFFNERYEVQTADPHTAFYILTPHFMERINNLNNRIGGRLYLNFQRKKVFIALNSNHNMFEIDYNSPNGQNIAHMRDKFRWEIRCIIDIIDELRQNKALFEE